MLKNILPKNSKSSVLLGRVFVPKLSGPSVVTIKGEEVIDISAFGKATSSDICELKEPVRYIQEAADLGVSIGNIEEIVSNSREDLRNPEKPWLLSPIDLQAVKAAGVTFVTSLLERVIEEKALGAADQAVQIRKDIEELLGGSLALLKPGSEQAAELKKALIAKNMWSQYLEVGIGPDAEIFTKCQPLASVGFGAHIGILPLV